MRYALKATAFALLSLTVIAVAQNQPTALHVQTDLVVVPFQVQRGSRSVSDLKPSDVVLLEDGVPRAFTGFEAPPDHPSLDLVVMFDVTDVERGGFWSAKALQDLTSYWNEAIARAIVEEPGATIRISVYQFDQFRLRRLCRSTSDPRELLAALGRLADPIPAGQGFDLQLPEGVTVREGDRVEKPVVIDWARSLLGAITVLRDSAAIPPIMPRALVIFSPGAEGTSITPQDLVDRAIAAGVPIYPVALPSNEAIWYDGYAFDPDGPLGFGRFGPNFGIGHGGRGRFQQWGICIDPELRGKGTVIQPGWLRDCPLNAPFEDLGKQTGGRTFEAVRRGPPDLPLSGEVPPLDRFSMTGGQVDDILQAVKKHALARFTSSYTVWFAPSAAPSPRTHKLEVRLAPKSSGKVTDGKRSATY